MFAHDLVPTALVVLVPGESIDQELFLVPAMLLHGLLDQVDCDLYWHYLALKDDAVNQISVWGPAISLSKIF